MKKRIAAILITALGITTYFICFGAGFSDISSEHWAYRSVQKMLDKKILNGFPDGTFRPENSVTRAEFSKMFTGAFGFTVRTAEEYANVLQYLPDAEAESWYYPYVCAALPCMFTARSGFRPDEAMTREDAAHAMSVIYGYMEPGGDSLSAREELGNTLSAFTDSAQISDGKKESVALAVQNGLMEGKGNGIFAPKEPLTRAEICVLVMRALDTKGTPPAEVLTRLQGSEYKIVYEPSDITLPASPENNPGNTPSASPVPSEPPSDETSSSSVSEMEKKVWELTNQARAKEGLSALQYDEKIADTARAHSADMAVRRFFDHTNPDGKSPFDRMKAAGFRYSTAAENIAWNQRSPEAVMDSWLNSPGHRANILNANLTHLGVGLHIATDGSYYWTQNFYTPMR